MIRPLAAGLVALLAAPGVIAGPPSTQVRIDAGRINGAREGEVIAWKGIPYAAPPIGTNRWRAPQPVPRWQGVKQTVRYGHDCMQEPFPSDAAPLGTAPAEDCLVTNVWRPAKAGTKLPVILWIYGGGFVNGGSSPDVYSGAHFARDGVIFVSFNYRLGRFGFFAHPALTAAGEGPTGNYGYQDQIAALQWVHRNITAFGGDPANVTILGESAGGVSTLNLLMLPQTRGLFSRVAVMSGGGRTRSLGVRDVRKDQPGASSGERIGLAFADQLGIRGTGPDALKALRALPADKVLQGLSMMSLFQSMPGPTTFVGGPMTDGYTMTHNPQQGFEAGLQAPVPVLIGSTDADLGFVNAPTKDALFASFGDRAEAARKAYDPDGTTDLATLRFMVGGDRGMIEPARYAAEQVAGRGQPAYLYRFSFVAQSLRPTQKTGAGHATDVPFAFDTVAAKYNGALTDLDRTMATAFHRIFVNFAKTGNPNDPGVDTWRRYDPARPMLMDFRMDGRAVGGPDPWRVRLDLVAQTAPPVPKP